MATRRQRKKAERARIVACLPTTLRGRPIRWVLRWRAGTGWTLDVRGWR